MGLPRRDALHHTYADYLGRARVPEVWLVHPVDKVLTIYRLENARFARPTIHELRGRTPVAAVPGLNIDWDVVQSHIGSV
jgi:Uma2 family endonuclease